MREFLGLPELASLHGAGIDQIIVVVHWLMIIMFVGWGALFVYMLFRFRQKKNPKAEYHGLKTKASSWAEWGVVVAEAILLVGFSIPLWSERVDDFPEPEESTVVRVIGEQFAWNVHYPGPDGEFGRTSADLVDNQTNPVGLDREDPAAADDVTTVNELRLPVDKPVIVHLSSKDVIHSFMLNEFRVKQDTIPGMSVPAWFVPTVTTAKMRQETGDPDYQYQIACAQLCGIGHARMLGRVIVETREEFDAWLAAQPKAGEAADAFWQ